MEARLDECCKQIQDLKKAVQFFQEQSTQLSQQVLRLSEIVDSQQIQIQQLTSSHPEIESSTISKLDESGTFKEFLRCNERAQERIANQKKRAKMEALKEVFTLMKTLNEIGKKNEHIFDCINLYIELLKEIKPDEEGWTWAQWWFSTQKVTLTDIKEVLLIRMKDIDDSDNDNTLLCLRTLLNLIDSVMDEQKEHASSESSWTAYLSTKEPDADLVKDKLNERLDKSGFEICKKLEAAIRRLDDDPAQFIEDHCAALLMSEGISADQKDRVKQFADAFALNDWVLVSEDNTPEEEVDWITWTLRKVRNTCSIYGYNSTVDHAINTAGEYKSTCARLKTTIEWVYFGGRLAVDPTGAMLSLLW